MIWVLLFALFALLILYILSGFLLKRISGKATILSKIILAIVLYLLIGIFFDLVINIPTFIQSIAGLSPRYSITDILEGILIWPLASLWYLSGRH